VSLFLGNENRTNIAKRLSVARSSVNLWVSNYLSNDLCALKNKQGAGRPKKLSIKQLDILSKHILLNMHSELSGRLTGSDIGEFIYLNFNVRYNSGHVYKIIKGLGYS
jgi:transposase